MAKAKKSEKKTEKKKKEAVAKKKKVKKSVPKAIATVSSNFNNTIITIADINGEVLAWGTPAMVGFKGSKRSTPYAATKAAEDLAERVKKFGVKEVNVKVNGIGPGRNAAVKGLSAAGIKIKSLMDITPVPHGGCSPRKRRRN